MYPKLTLAIAADTSGSCFDKDTIGQFSAEIEHISKNNVKVIVLTFDSEVHQVFDFDKRTFDKIKFEGGGGTMFQPVFDKCNELEIDGLIMLTDGMNFEGDQLKKPKNFSVMWALLKGYKKPYEWGSSTQIEIQRKS